MEDNEKKARVLRALRDMIAKSETDAEYVDWVGVPRDNYWEVINAVNALFSIKEVP